MNLLLTADLIKFHLRSTENFQILTCSEMNQGLISSKGGVQLLANTVVKTEDAQTLRMVAGAIANLCGNGKLRSSSAVVCVVSPI